MKQIATYQIHDTFKITGREGIVLTGKILDGEIPSLGCSIEFEFKGQKSLKKIKGVEIGRRLFKGDPIVGFNLEILDKNEIKELWDWDPQETVGKIYEENEN